MQVKPFAQFLHEQRRGVLHEELSEQLHDLVKAVTEEGKQGTLTLQINVRPGEAGGVIVVVDKATLKVPVPANKPSLYYVEGEGNLTLRDPRQPELPGPRAVEDNNPADAAVGQ